MNNDFYESYYSALDSQTWKWRELGGTVKARNIVEVASHLGIKSVLDIGCGTGAILAQLERTHFGNAYYAIDITQTAIDIVQQRPDIPHLCEAKLFDGIHIPYKKKYFDLAILSHVVEHIADPTPLIREAARVANYVAIEVPLEANLYTLLKVKLLQSRYREEIGHIQWFSKSSFLNLLHEKCGLQIEEDRLVSLPNDVYFFRKQGISRALVRAQLELRTCIRKLSANLYTRLLTDHYIALVREAPKIDP